MIEERRAQHSAVKRLEERLAKHEARALLAALQPLSPDAARVIVTVLDDASPEYLRLLAATLVSEANAISLLASRSTGHVVLAQTKGLAAADLGAILREALKQFPGKGGGAPDFAQGLLADPGQAEQFLSRTRNSLSMKQGLS
jgi:alanyl-tRNA synthetase